MTTLHRAVRRSLIGAAAALCCTQAAAAQSHVCTSASDASHAESTTWANPLDRVITIRAVDVSLRDALDRVAAVGHVRLSYSTELLPLDTAVCLSADHWTVGRVLTHLLGGLNVSIVPTSGDQIVLAPRTASTSSTEMAPSLGMLNRVVVTGSAVGAPQRSLTVGLNVIDGKALGRDNASTVSSALDAFVPGIWSWAQSPASLLTSYASIRGASSFGLSYPKIYIDGIEVANPLLVSRFTPSAIDRIEVIRGPQGSALYGTDAISGVVNIVTSHDNPEQAGRGSAESVAGMTESRYTHGVLSQNHEIALLAGTSARSASLHVSGGSVGDFIPNGYSRDLLANGSARIVGNRTTLSATARFFTAEAGRAASPLLAAYTPIDSGSSGSGSSGGSGGSNEMRTSTDVAPQSVRQYTVGATGTVLASDEWTHTFVAGIDGYRLANVQTNLTPIPSVADSALRAAQGGADRATLRASSVWRVPSANDVHTTFTFSAEHATLRETSLQQSLQNNRGRPVLTRFDPQPPSSSKFSEIWQNSTGVTTQANMAVKDRLFLTGGVRVEHDSRLVASGDFVVLPMVGAALVGDHGPFTVKLRAAYGEGVRPPSSVGHADLIQHSYGIAVQPTLGAERQSGIEGGVDVYWRHLLSFQLTRFDQRATGLIQQVGVPAESLEGSHRMAYVLQNVGEIANRGWELAGGATAGRLKASGTFSYVDSRVVNLATGYTGDLATGDRMLQVPTRTMGLNLGWLGNHWYAAVGTARALDWTNYDEIALSQAFASGTHSARELSGPQLRQYWRTYDGGTRLRASLSHDIGRSLALEIRGDNLLNNQTDEPDNVTVVPGRTLMTGLRVRF